MIQIFQLVKSSYFLETVLAENDPCRAGMYLPYSHA